MWDMGGMLGSGEEAGTGSISDGRYWPSGPMGPATTQRQRLSGSDAGLVGCCHQSTNKFNTVIIIIMQTIKKMM